MLRGIPIRYSGPALIALPVLVIGLAMSLFWRHGASDAVHRVAEQGIGEIHTLVEDRVRSLLSVPPRVCALNELLIEAGTLDPQTPGEWRSTLLAQYRQFDMLSAITLGAVDGRAAWVSRYADGEVYWALREQEGERDMLEWRLDEHGQIGAEADNRFAFDLTTRPWFSGPLESGGRVWTEPYPWLGGTGPTLGISHAVPIRDERGEIYGVVAADYSLSDLSRFLSTIEIGPGGFIALVDRDGLLVGASSPIEIFDEQHERRSIRDPALPVLAALADRLVGDGARRGRLEPVGVGEETYLLRVSAVSDGLGIDWVLVTAGAQSDFTGRIDRGFQLSSVLSMVAVLCVGLLGFLTARWVIRPLGELVSAAHRIGEGDLDFETDISHAPEYNRLGNAMNAMIVALKDRMRMRRSLQLASEVQQNLLPSGEPSIEGLDICGHSTYCDETGGDYYDFLDISDGDHRELVVALGDVMGHGVAAAMLMATARGILRSRCAQSGSLAEFLDHLNELLLPDTEGVRFMTMLLATLDVGSSELRWASAGHGPPIIFDRNRDEFLDLSGGGIPLGIADFADYEEYAIDVVTPGHLIILATDGIWEAKDERGELYGMDRFHELIRSLSHLSAHEISAGIQKAIATHQGLGEPDDDMTFVIIRVP